MDFSCLKILAKKETPVFVLSNLSQENDKKRAKDLGAVKFLVKPDVQLIDIVAAVKKHLS